MSTPTIGQINREVFGGDRYPFRAFLGEIGELISSILHGDAENTRAELEQVVFDLQHLVFYHTRFDFVPVGCDGFIAKLYDRLGVWKRIFESENVTFHPHCLRGGSNYSRPDKVDKALALGRAEAWRRL
jgi:hypothetical protein